MAYQAVVFNVMIASPSDVEDERKIARRVIYRWNQLHSLQSQKVLMPLGWETHSTPTHGIRPQDAINEQVLADADLVIGIFGARIGTSTGKVISGTVEEIEKHTQAGKPAMIYFSNRPLERDSFEIEQYEKLNEFKKYCTKSGLIAEFDSIENFESKLYQDLCIKIQKHTSFELSNLTNNDHSDYSERPELSTESQELLIEASKDPNGTVMKLSTQGGLSVQIIEGISF